MYGGRTNIRTNEHMLIMEISDVLMRVTYLREVIMHGGRQIDCRSPSRVKDVKEEKRKRRGREREMKRE